MVSVTEMLKMTAIHFRRDHAVHILFIMIMTTMMMSEIFRLHRQSLQWLMI
jgi:hypothetical protein